MAITRKSSRRRAFFKLGVEVVGRTHDAQVSVEFLAYFGNLVNGFDKALQSAAHTYEVPHDMAEFLVQLVGRLGTLDCHEFGDTLAYALLGGVEFGSIGGETRHLDLVAEIVLHCVGQHEITVSKTLHQRGSAQAVCTVVREVALTDGEEALDGGLQLVVNPDTTHCVVAGGEDHHRGFIGVVVRNHLVHVEQVAVTVAHHIGAETLDGILEVEIYCITGADTVTGVAALLGGTRSDVAGTEVTEGGITALQIEVAVLVGDIGRFLLAGADGFGILFLFLGTQIRPSLRSDSLISVSLLWSSP